MNYAIGYITAGFLFASLVYYFTGGDKKVNPIDILMFSTIMIGWLVFIPIILFILVIITWLNILSYLVNRNRNNYNCDSKIDIDKDNENV